MIEAPGIDGPHPSPAVTWALRRRSRVRSCSKSPGPRCRAHSSCTPVMAARATPSATRPRGVSWTIFARPSRGSGTRSTTVAAADGAPARRGHRRRLRPGRGMRSGGSGAPSASAHPRGRDVLPARRRGGIPGGGPPPPGHARGLCLPAARPPPRLQAQVPHRAPAGPADARRSSHGCSPRRRAMASSGPGPALTDRGALQMGKGT